MKFFSTLFLVLSFASGAFSQTVKSFEFESFLLKKEWLIKYDAHQRTGIGDVYEKDKRSNLFMLKNNNEYSLKLEGIERSGNYLIEGNFLFLFADDDYELPYEKNRCVAFRLKLINQTSLEITSVAYASEGTIMILVEY
jgi:hypothetical protein